MFPREPKFPWRITIVLAWGALLSCAGPSGEGLSAQLSIGQLFDRAEAVVAGRVSSLEGVERESLPAVEGGWTRVTIDVESELTGSKPARDLVGKAFRFMVPTGWTYPGQPPEIRETYGDSPPPVTGAALVDTGDQKALFIHRRDPGREWVLTDRTGMWGWAGQRVWPGTRQQVRSLSAGAKKGEATLAGSLRGVDASIEIDEFRRIWDQERSSREDVKFTLLRWRPGS